MERTEDDQASSHSRCKGAAPSSLQSQEHGRHQENAAEGRKHAHRNIWDAGLNVIFSDLLKVEFTVKACKPAEKRDEELGQGRVDIHKEFALDVFRSEATETAEKQN